MLDAPAEPAPIALLDPGWLFLICGITILGATVLIPAFEELGEVRWQRDRALAIEEHRVDRVRRYEDYLGALQREEPALMLALAASQLNQIPADRTPILDVLDPASPSASVFRSLEPPPAELPERRHVDSVLTGLTTNERTRPWMLAGAVLCLLLGLLPRSR